MENNSDISAETGNRSSFHLYYIYAIIIISIFLFLLKIILKFDESPSILTQLKDVDFRTLSRLMENDLLNYYNSSSIGGYRAIYLYYWYIIFYPFYLIPLDISVYIWDILRIIATIYIAKELYKITEDKKDLIFFFILCGLGYFADMYLNNINWLLCLLLYLSYIELENDRKWLAGIFFAIAMLKINIIIFPFILLLVKKIKFKDLLYYIVPLGLLCIPYLIIPDYFSQLFFNWTYLETESTGADNIFFRLYIFSWAAFQTAQLMYMSLMGLIFLTNVKNEVWRNRFRIIIFLFLIILNLSFPFILWEIA